MDSKKEIFKSIEAYLENTMSPEEKSEFEQRLTKDKELADTWKLNQEVDHAIHPKIMDMANLLEGLGDEFAQDYEKEEKPERPNSKLRPLLMFLLVGIISLTIGFFWWNSNKTVAPNPERIFAEAYEPYPVSAAVRSVEDPLFSELEAAQKKYQDGEYLSAITSFSALLQDDNSSDNDIVEIRFYKGLSHLGNEDFLAAKQELDIVLASENIAYMQQTQWYLALIELKNNNPTSAKTYLDGILEITEEGKYAKKAKSLLEQLTD